MRNRQQLLLFLTNFVMYFTGMGLFPLLPPYAARFGASQTTMGIFLASLSAMNAVGAILASRLLARYEVKRLFIFFGAVGVPALLLLPLAGNLALVIGATGAVWFSGGFVGALLNVLTGLAVPADARGRAFGLLYLASPIAAVLGGAILGAVVGQFGYAPAFFLLTILWSLIPLFGLMLQKTEGIETAPDNAATPRPARLGKTFYLILGSALAIMAAIQVGNIAALLTMEAQQFSTSAISSTTVVSGLLTIPVALFAGSLADRIGRRTLLLLSYLLVILTVMPLATASELWHFSAGISLLMVATTVARPGMSALAADLLPPARLQRALPLLDAGIMGVGVVGSAGAGYVLEAFGPAGVSTFSVTLALVGGIALVWLCASCALARTRTFFRSLLLRHSMQRPA